MCLRCGGGEGAGGKRGGRRRGEGGTLMFTRTMIHPQITENSDTADHPLRHRGLSRERRFMSADRAHAWPKAIVPYDFNLPNNADGSSSCLSECLSLCVCLCLPVFLSACLHVRPPVRLYIFLSVSVPDCLSLSSSWDDSVRLIER